MTTFLDPEEFEKECDRVRRRVLLVFDYEAALLGYDMPLNGTAEMAMYRLGRRLVDGLNAGIALAIDNVNQSVKTLLTTFESYEV